ncbi:hypothetical protein MYX76_06385 [Desulfobacterota bacterium AH_259_B03_O07]|nr:hypothetical protein [Desulfobacterota bacterium AH_259_B03_O07]
MGIEARGFENPEWTKFCGEALTEPEMKCPIVGILTPAINEYFLEFLDNPKEIFDTSNSTGDQTNASRNQSWKNVN